MGDQAEPVCVAALPGVPGCDPDDGSVHLACNQVSCGAGCSVECGEIWGQFLAHHAKCEVAGELEGLSEAFSGLLPFPPRL